jgi:NADH-quinone oxidoreductase subunit K
MNEMVGLQDQLRLVPLEHYVFLCIVLFCIGMTGVLLRRNLINVFLSIELMLNSVNLLAVAFSVYHNDPNGQAFVFFVMVVAAAEVAVGLAMLVMIYRNTRTVDINALNQLKW